MEMTKMMMKKEKRGRLSLIRDTRGLSSVEYLVLLVVVAVAGIAVWKKLGKSISDKAGAASKSLDEMSSAAPTPSN
jgi:Flp pilus assembly pilin Flp